MSQLEGLTTKEVEKLVLAAFLRAACDLAGSQTALARDTPINLRTISMATSGQCMPSWTTVTHIWRGFESNQNRRFAPTPYSAPRLDSLVALLVEDIESGAFQPSSLDRVRTEARQRITERFSVGRKLRGAP